MCVFIRWLLLRIEKLGYIRCEGLYLIHLTPEFQLISCILISLEDGRRGSIHLCILENDVYSGNQLYVNPSAQSEKQYSFSHLCLEPFHQDGDQ